MINVTVKDGDYAPMDLYDDIEHDYINSDLSVKEIRRKYHLTNSQWNTIRNEIKANTGCVRSVKDGWAKRDYGKDAKYYTYDKIKDEYVVSKYDSEIGKKMRYGRFKTENEAIKAVQWLKKNNWSKILFLEKFSKKIPQPKNYRKNGNKWEIVKTINKHNIYFGLFESENEAKKAVQWLREHNWDKELFKKEYLK